MCIEIYIEIYDRPVSWNVTNKTVETGRKTDSTRMWEIENVASHTDPNYKVARLAVSKFQPAVLRQLCLRDCMQTF